MSFPVQVGALFGSAHEALWEAATDPANARYLGINAPKLYRYEATVAEAMASGLDPALDETVVERKWGTLESQLLDMTELGAAYLRQLTDVDLVWPGQEAGGVPVAGGSDPADPGAVYEAYRDARYQSFFDLVMRMGTAGWKGGYRFSYVLTVPTLGQARGELVDPVGEMVTGRMVEMDWQRGHREERVTWWDGDSVGIGDIGFSGTTTDTLAPGDSAWIFGTLDLRSRYKLYYMYLMGKAAARLLVEVQADIDAMSDEDFYAYQATIPESEYGSLDARPNIFEHIWAIELGNELNHSNTVDNEVSGVESQARLWARMVVEVARGIQEELGESRRVNLWFPSLSSYYSEEGGDAETPTFNDGLWFQSALVDAILDYAEEYPDTAPPVDLTWFVNQDYHYYHFGENQAAGPIARLVEEVDQLAETFASTETKTGEAPFAGTTITISETGVSVDSDRVDWGAYPYLARFEDAPTDTRSGALERFQAREVWRRLVVALAVTPGAGWNTSMSESGNNPFRASGLREDTGASTRPTEDDPAPQTAAEAHTRLSWWAYQRLRMVTSLHGTGFESGAGSYFSALSLVWFPGCPESPDAGVMAGDLDLSRLYNVVYILRAAPTQYADYAYVILVDPAAPESLEGTLEVEPTLGRVVQLASTPEAVSDGTATETTSLPVDSPDSGFDTPMLDVSAPSKALSFDLRPDMDPILLLASEELSFRLVESA